jgi:branched-chain amino acid transport system permease protein
MKKYLIVVFLLLIFLSACTSAEKNTTATPTASSPAGPLDGNWQGSGRANGIPYQIFFTVQNSVVTKIRYSFINSKNTSCLNINYIPIDKAHQPTITDNSFSATLGPDLNVSAIFKNDSSASGHLSGTLTRFRRETLCNGSFEVDWTAEKQIVQAAAPPKAPPSHPFQTLIQILVFGFSNGAVLALNAIGVTIIYSTVRTLNLAHGDVFALATVVVTTLVRDLGLQRNWSPPVLIGSLLIVFCVAIAAGALLSVGVEELGFRPFRGHSRFAPVIATLGLSFILFQGALVWRTLQPSWIPGEHRSVPGLPEVPTDGIPSLLPEINLVHSLKLPLNIVIRFSDVFVLVVAFLFVAIATWFLKRTRTGRAIRAYSQNQLLAQILGINVNQTIRRAFAFGGALAGAAAFIFAIYYARPFGQHGAQSGLLAFAAALLGGIGSPVGALISGLFVGMVSSLGDYYLSAQWTSVIMLTLLIGLLVWQPTGLASDDSVESAAVRDSVILTAPVQGPARNRWLVVALVVLGVLPILMQVFNLSGQIILRTVAVYIVLTLGLNLALGIAGLLDFGFALSYGAGAYVTAILSARFGFVPALLGGVLAAILTGVIKGGLGSRLRGDYLAVATLALGLLGRQVIVNLRSWTGGAGGLGSFPGPAFLGLNLGTPLEKYFLVFAAVLFAVWISQRLRDSRSGRAWIATSEDETAAISVGIDVVRSRMMAFVLSSALAGLAGGLFASTFSLADPDMLAFHVTSIVLTMVILGGAGSTIGAIVGAVLIVLFDKLFVPQLADLVALIWPKNLFIGPVPDIRGANFFNFGIALYLTVLLRARRKNSDSSS